MNDNEWELDSPHLDKSEAKLLVRESSQVLFFSNPLVSLFSKHGQILFKLTHSGE